MSGAQCSHWIRPIPQHAYWAVSETGSQHSKSFNTYNIMIIASQILPQNTGKAVVRVLVQVLDKPTTYAAEQLSKAIDKFVDLFTTNNR